MLWMPIWWLLGPALIAVLVWALLKSGRGSNGPRESPEEILKRRYAGGEIDRETYLRMRSDLGG
jgi:putative membrane protein